MSILASLEKKYDIKIDGEKLVELTTLRNTVKIIEELL